MGFQLLKQGLRAVRRGCSVGAAALLCVALISSGSASAQGADLLPAARDAARANRNAEAARLFEIYLQQHPQRRREVLREYADQLIYSGRPERAIPLLREVLSWETDNQKRRRAEQSLALARLWSDQHRQAVAAYDAILAQDAGNEDALLNRARALQWLGRPDRAEAALDMLPPGIRTNARAQEIGRELKRNARPLASASGRYVDQADGLEITTFRLEQTLFAGAGTAQFRPFHEHRRVKQEEAGEITVHAPGVAGSLRASDALQLSGSVGVERQLGPGVSRTQGVYEAALAIMPSDRVRFDLVTARRTLDNYRSLQMGITTRHVFASGDYWPEPMWKLTLRGELTHFSDGNDRQWLQAEAGRRLSRRPNIFVGARATAFSFEKRLDHGYFNPKRFQSVELTTRGWSQIGRSTWLDLSAAAGPEQTSPGGTKLAYSLRGKLSHELTQDLDVSIVGERQSSGSATGTGFSRNIVSASLGLRW